MTSRDLPAPLPLEAEAPAVRERLLGLLARQAALYTDSTSLPEGTALALLDAIQFSLELLFVETGLTPSALLEGDPSALLARAETAVRRQVGRARLLYARALRCRFQEESLALEETLASIGIFFRVYDPRFFAAELPCEIDYPLCHPVPGELRGVLYLRSYLDRLLTEDAFLRRFDPPAVRRVLGAVCPPMGRELLVNLYEPVAAAALGLTLTEGDLFPLDMTRRGQGRLGELLSPLPPGQRLERLRRAGKTLAARLELGDAGRAYLLKTAEALAPRVEAVLDRGGGWQMLFPAFS